MQRWRILVIEDDETIGRQVEEHLATISLPDSDSAPQVVVHNSFSDGLAYLQRSNVDVVILDVRDQARAERMEGPDQNDSDLSSADLGAEIFHEIRAARFVPIVFYTALPQLVAHLVTPDAPFVALVSKYARDPFDELDERLREIFDSKLPVIYRALHEHVEGVVRDFMIQFVERHWSELSSPPRKGDLAHLLLRRLALSLGAGGAVLEEQLEGTGGVDLVADKVHPMRFYVTPPVGPCTTGDLLRGPTISPPTYAPTSDPRGESPGTGNTWYVVLTPACDLVAQRRKADYLVLAECVLLTTLDEHKAWVSQQAVDPGAPAAEAAEKKLKSLLMNNPQGRQKDRLVYLPAAWAIPDMFVDLQRVVHLPFERLDDYERVATLDSPYAEALVEQFGRYLGRLGTPDLDVAIALGRLQPRR